MRFSTVFSALAIVVSGATASNITFTSDSITTAMALNAKNHFGAPIPPWELGHYPGWYYGHGTPPKGVFCILDECLCELLEHLHLGFYCPKPPPPPPPHSPPPPPEYSQSFYNLTCSAQDGSYQTYGLVDTVADCQAMCDSVAGCTFVNSYHDNNSAAKNSTQLTCALYTKCLAASSADNCGGQSQPDGSVDFITNSDGYCKKKPTVAS